MSETARPGDTNQMRRTVPFMAIYSVLPVINTTGRSCTSTSCVLHDSILRFSEISRKYNRELQVFPLNGDNRGTNEHFATTSSFFTFNYPLVPLLSINFFMHPSIHPPFHISSIHTLIHQFHHPSFQPTLVSVIHPSSSIHLYFHSSFIRPSSIPSPSMHPFMTI